MRAAAKGYLVLVVAAVVTLSVIGGLASDDRAKARQDKAVARLIYSLHGPHLYRAHCAPCHGVDGKGQRPVAPALKQPLPDLTTIARNNGGVFPTEMVKQVISGDQVLLGHGSRDMPIRGQIFHQIENDRDYGYVACRTLPSTSDQCRRSSSDCNLFASRF